MSIGERSPFAFMGPYMVSFLVLGIALPALLYALIMILLGWRNPAFGASGAGVIIDPRASVVYLYESPSTQQYFANVGGNYENLLVPWRNYLSERNRTFKTIKSSREIASIGSQILLLPSAVALSEAERAAIVSHRARGGSILATWATGSRTERGDWLGWKFLEQLGASDVSEMPVTAQTRHLILTGESPLSHTHGAGHRIWMGKGSESLLHMKGSHAAGRFMDWARTPDATRSAEGALLFHEESRTGARTVLLGFPESAWDARPTAAHTLFEDVMRWLAHDAAVVKAAWPNAARAAQVIQMDTEDGFENSLVFADLMKSAALPATFFLLTSVAKDHPAVVRKLAENFELGFHGDVHTGFKDEESGTQNRRLMNMRGELAAVYASTTPMTGFRAPTESYDATTEGLLHRAAFRYHAADPNRTEDRLPLFAKVNPNDAQDDLLVLPRTQRDDINLAPQWNDPARVAGILIEDFDEALQTGALGWLSVHSQNFRTGSPLARAFPEYLSHVRKSRGNVFHGSANQIEHWWRARERIRVGSRFDGKRVDLDITVTGSEPVNHAAVIIMLPFKGVTAQVRAVKVGTALPTVRSIDAFRSALIFDQVKPGNYNYQITF